MDWMKLFYTCLIASGGFTVATYEVLARKMALPVGRYFQTNGPMTILGGFVTVGAIILSAFINPWWTIFLVFVTGWLVCQLLVMTFKSISQLLTIILIFIGSILLIIDLL